MLNDVTRLEVIDETGRAFTRWDIKLQMLSLQDDGRTLKIFIAPEEEAK